MLVALFLLAHGFLHSVLWLLIPSEEVSPVDMSQSWVLDALRISKRRTQDITVVAAWLTAGSFLLAAGMLAIDALAWPAMAVIAASIALVFKALWFHRWLWFGMALDLAIITAVAFGWPAL
jgi:hypothetical protein